MVDTQDIKAGFVARLNKALDAIPGVRAGRGRNVDLYEGIRNNPQAKASTQATHKWLSGESMPSRTNMLAIAEWLNVRAEWLAYGEGDMQASTERNAQKNDKVDAAMALFQRATPRSQAIINRITELEAQGKLTAQDLKMLAQIIERFGA